MVGLPWIWRESSLAPSHSSCGSNARLRGAPRRLADPCGRRRPAESDHVFIGRRGEPILDVRGGFDAAVLAVWKPANVTKHLSPNLSAARINRETLLEFAEKRERESPTPAAGTRRKTFAFLRAVFSWAVARPARTGLTRSPFDELRKEDRRRLFPKAEKRGYLYGPEELRAIYELLPSYEVPFVRFAVHTGMRLREITTLTWAAVDFEGRVVHVEARFAKNGKAREVALGDVAFSIVSALRLAGQAGSDHVFLGRRGDPIQDVRGGFDAAVLSVWKPSKPGERKPRFHDLRKTGATRVEAVSSHAVPNTFLGHSDENETDTYILPSLDEVRNAIDRAARSIDGETPAGAILFPINPSQEP